MRLAISSSTSIFSCGLMNSENKVVASVYFAEKRIQERILKIIDFLSGIDSQIDSLAVDVGPGGFTGLRIALSVVKTISFVKKIPIYTSYSLDLIRYNTISRKVVSGIDGKGRIFLRIYDDSISEILDLTLDETIKLIEERELTDYEFIGDAFLVYRDYFKGLKVNDIFYYPTIDSFPKCWVGPYSYDILPYYGRKSQAEERMC